jgi:starvation-inducible DNA-binding protein
MDIDIGISPQDRETIAQHLSRVLADTYMLYLKTHAYHWNVTGPMFSSLHLLFETQYTQLHNTTDLLAERIRALGHFAPGSYQTYTRLSGIREDNEEVPAALSMVRNLVAGHEALSRSAREAFKAADKVDDQPTIDLLTGLMEASQKSAWMLRSHLENPASETMVRV